MTSTNLCASCLVVYRSCQKQCISISNPSTRNFGSRALHTSRTYTTTRPFAAAQVAGPKVKSSAVGPPSSSASQPSAKPPASKEEPRTTASIGPTHGIAKELRKRASATTETYVAYGVCQKLLKECSRQADYRIPQALEKNVEVPKTKAGEDLGVGEGWWYDTLGLTPTFATWAQITFLHMYFLTCRFRCFAPSHVQPWHQHLLDHFFYLAEEKMTIYHGMVATSVRNRHLKDLFVQWRGVLAAYDEGLVRGDAALATAIWRNIFKANEDVNFTGVGEVVSYTRGVIKGLDQIEDDAIARGEVVFGSPGTEQEGVLVKSRMFDAPFEKAAS